MVQVPGVQPMCTIDDALEAEAIILNDPVIAQLVKERYNITDVKNQLVADPWYYGARTEDQEEEGGRIMTAFMYMKNGPLDNHYAHPLDLYVHLDMTAKKVLHDRCFMHKKVRPQFQIASTCLAGVRIAIQQLFMVSVLSSPGCIGGTIPT